MKKQKLLKILIFISLIIFIPLIYYNKEQILTALIGLTIALISAITCFKLSLKIKSNQILAYFIGLILGLFGLFFYWIYYLIKKRK
jgi:hypothetical protein